MREAYRRIRIDLAEELPPRAFGQVMEHLSEEGLRLRAASRAVGLVHEAFRGKRFVPRL